MGLDTWAMEEVVGLREKHPRITLQCVLPYAGMTERFAGPDRERFARIEANIQIMTILNERYRRGCMQQRNEFMVDRAGYVVAAWTGRKSGTANTVAYAKKRSRTVFCLNIA